MPETEPKGSGQPGVSPGLLTAGSFNDGLNLQTFLNFLGTTVLGPNRDEAFNSWSKDWQATANQPSTAQVSKEPKKTLEISFIVDTTGSMGDELEWLKEDFKALAKSIQGEFADLAPRYSLVVYRDDNDAYVTRGFGFTSNVELLASQIEAQSAGGGNDYPEALDLALQDAASKLQWKPDAHKIAFVIADAPPHDDRIASTFAAVEMLKSKNVRIFPVAASGTDKTAEAILRTAAVVTGGHYIFLTDDSGIGNTHTEPKFPCYYVESLSNAVMRSIRSSVAGKHVEPEAKDIVRTVGQPLDGRCK
jgi:hypothetical protein